jgi:hypothetical protein
MVKPQLGAALNAKFAQASGDWLEDMETLRKNIVNAHPYSLYLPKESKKRRQLVAAIAS